MPRYHHIDYPFVCKTHYVCCIATLLVSVMGLDYVNVSLVASRDSLGASRNRYIHYWTMARHLLWVFQATRVWFGISCKTTYRDIYIICICAMNICIYIYIYIYIVKCRYNTVQYNVIMVCYSDVTKNDCFWLSFICCSLSIGSKTKIPDKIT